MSSTFAQYVDILRCMTQSDWAERLTARVAREIERRRTSSPAGKRSAQWLSDRTHELGYRVGRSRISDLETGRRRRMDIAELLIIAEALEVTPVELLFPGLPDGEVEYLPGKTTSAWDALKRATGEISSPLQASDPDSPGFYLLVMRQLDELTHKAEELRGRLGQVNLRIDEARAAGDDSAIEAKQREKQRLSAELDQVDSYANTLRVSLASAGFTVRLLKARP